MDFEACLYENLSLPMCKCGGANCLWVLGFLTDRPWLTFALLVIQEHECFQEELRKAQRKLLKVSRDKR